MLNILLLTDGVEYWKEKLCKLFSSYTISTDNNCVYITTCLASITIRSTVPLNKHYNCIVLDRLVTRNEFKTLSQMNPTDFPSIVKTSGYLNAYWLKTTLKDFD